MEQIKQGEAAFLGAVVHCAVCVEGVCNSAGCVRTKAKPWPHSRAGPGVTSAALVAPGVPGAALGLRLGSLWDVSGVSVGCPGVIVGCPGVTVGCQWGQGFLLCPATPLTAPLGTLPAGCRSSST